MRFTRGELGPVEVAELSLSQAEAHQPRDDAGREMRRTNIAQLKRWLKVASEDRERQSQRPGS